MTLKQIPAELRKRRQWVCWRQKRRSGTPTKVPVNPHNGTHAATDDPSSWSDYDDAVAALERHECDGVGFVFTRDDPYAGVDLDHCIDELGGFGQVAQEILDAFATYTEVSPSGSGLHCILRGSVPAGARKRAVLGDQPVEVYSEGRFFCMTGDAVMNETPIGEAQRQLEALCGRLKAAARAQDNSRKKLGLGEGRNSELTRRLGVEVAKGVTGVELARRARELNDFDPPLDEAEVAKILRSAESWPVSRSTTDSGNAERFITMFGHKVRYCALERTWYVYDDRRWRRDERLTVEELMRQALLAVFEEAAHGVDDAQAMSVGRSALRLQSAHARRAALECARSDPRIAVHPADFDRHLWLLNCRNGTLDLHTATLRAHDPKDLICQLAPVDYDAAASHEVWKRFLAEVTCGDADLAAFIQRAVGYGLTGDTRERVFFLLLGPTTTGKSTFIEALSATLGDYAYGAGIEAFLRRSSVGGARPEIAALAGPRLVTGVEVDRKRRLDEVLIKQIVGGDTISERDLYVRAVPFKPQCKLWLAANAAPRLSDTDDALWERARHIPFTRQFSPLEKDPSVKATLTAPSEAGAAILAWAVRGCLAWQQHGLGSARVVRQATQELRLSMDPLSDFLAECCCLEPGTLTSNRELRLAYHGWLAAWGAVDRMGPKEWGQRLRTHGLEPAKVGSQRGYRGIRLNESDRTA